MFGRKTAYEPRWVVRRLVGGRPFEYLRLTKGGYRWTRLPAQATRFTSPDNAHKEIQWSELAWHHGVAVYEL